MSNNRGLVNNVAALGCLAGSVSKVCDSWAQGYEFASHGGYRDYLNKQTFKKMLQP